MCGSTRLGFERPPALLSLLEALAAGVHVTLTAFERGGERFERALFEGALERRVELHAQPRALLRRPPLARLRLDPRRLGRRARVRLDPRGLGGLALRPLLGGDLGAHLGAEGGLARLPLLLAPPPGLELLRLARVRLASARINKR